LDRIVDQRLSPQYVSVHSTDPEIRRYLLGRKRPDDVLGKLRFLAGHRIDLHAQIVLCPGINDGDALEKTVRDLALLYPSLTSIAVVPVVVTSLHNYRHLLTPVTNEYSRTLIKQVRGWQREFRSRFGSAFVFLADEFYLRAGLQVPGEAHYGDYPQIEDGVGMVRRFMSEVRRALRRPDLASEMNITAGGDLDGTVATGELFYPILSDAIKRLNERLGSRLRAVAVRNRFFGEEVTVAGLIAGGDVLAARDSFKGRFLIVPEQACLKSGDTFLDDMRLSDLEQRLGLPVSHGGPSVFTLFEKAQELVSRSAAAIRFVSEA
jgi:putative radical SAM enzyme (TIGR03279 family)